MSLIATVVSLVRSETLEDAVTVLRELTDVMKQAVRATLASPAPAPKPSDKDLWLLGALAECRYLTEQELNGLYNDLVIARGEEAVFIGLAAGTVMPHACNYFAGHPKMIANLRANIAHRRRGELPAFPPVFDDHGNVTGGGQ
jgi:hypothetical protein